MTITQMKIEALSAEIEKRKEDIKSYNSALKRSIEEIVRYKSGTEIRNEEVNQLEKDLDSLKNSIPDFSQETCEKYIKYNDMKKYYERIIADYQKIDERIKKAEIEITQHEACIAEAEQRIAYLNDILEETKKDNLKGD